MTEGAVVIKSLNDLVHGGASNPDEECRILRRRRGAALEDAICRAAFDELSEGGFAALTIEAVAARAQTGKASIYRRWPTKDGLLRAAFAHCIPTPQKQATAAIPATASVREVLLSVMTAVARAVDSERSGAVHCFAGEAVRDPELAELLERAVLRPRREEFVALLRTRGQIASGAPVEMVAELVQSFVLTRILLRNMTVDVQAVREFVDTVAMPLLRSPTPAPDEASVGHD